MTSPAFQRTMTRVVVLVAAAILAAFAAGFTFILFAGVVGTLAGLRQGVLMAFSDGLIAVAVLLHLSPVVLGGFLAGSFCAGVPTYLILRRLGRAEPWSLAFAGALLSGLAGIALSGAFGPLFIPPVAASGAVGALIFRIAAEQMPWLPKPPPAPPS